MDPYEETFATWNKIASTYGAKFMDFDLYNDTYDVFCKLLTQEGSKVLDIGCGPGNITKYILSKRSDFNVIGIDIAPNMVELARLNNPRVEFLMMDGRLIFNLEPTYQGIICGFYLPYLSHYDRKELIKNCSHILTNYGILYISFVEGESCDSGYISNEDGERMYFYYHLLDDLNKDLIHNKFETIRVFRKT